ncbi:MAG: hypothetical protein IV094_03830 [Vitreoscilla sp.]|nr:hypothetical protein [Vitreoscilla sp.]
MLTRLVVGPQSERQPMFERRLFCVRTLPVLTWVAGTIVGLLVLFILLQRRAWAGQHAQPCATPRRAP